MRAKVREILDDCIADGLRSGYAKAYKYEDFPCEETLISHMEDYIWLEIDRKFDFERNLCKEVVEGFDQLKEEREWVGLTKEDRDSVFADSWFVLSDQVIDEIEAILKEKNT